MLNNSIFTIVAIIASKISFIIFQITNYINQNPLKMAINSNLYPVLSNVINISIIFMLIINILLIFFQFYLIFVAKRDKRLEIFDSFQTTTKNISKYCCIHKYIGYTFHNIDKNALK